MIEISLRTKNGSFNHEVNSNTGKGTKRNSSEITCCSRDKNAKPRITVSKHDLIDKRLIWTKILPYLNNIHDIINYRSVNKYSYTAVSQKTILTLPNIFDRIFDPKIWSRSDEVGKSSNLRLHELVRISGSSLTQLRLTELKMPTDIGDWTLDFLSRKCYKLTQICIVYKCHITENTVSGETLWRMLRPQAPRFCTVSAHNYKLTKSLEKITTISDQGLKILASACKHVETIWLQNFPIGTIAFITEEGILTLVRNSPKLRTLVLSLLDFPEEIDCPFKDDFLTTILSHCTSLEHLALFGCTGMRNQILIDCYSEGKPIPLKSLGIGDSEKVSPEKIFKFIKNCPNLRSLYYIDYGVKDMGKLIKVCPQLRLLGFSGYVDWKYLKKMTTGMHHLETIILYSDYLHLYKSIKKMERTLQETLPRVKIYLYCDLKQSVDSWLELHTGSFLEEDLFMIKAFLNSFLEDREYENPDSPDSP